MTTIDGKLEYADSFKYEAKDNLIRYEGIDYLSQNKDYKTFCVYYKQVDDEHIRVYGSQDDFVNDVYYCIFEKK